MLTAAANQFRLQGFTASVAEFSIIGKFGLAVRAFHDKHLSPELCLEYMISYAICQEVNYWDIISRPGVYNNGPQNSTPDPWAWWLWSIIERFFQQTGTY